MSLPTPLLDNRTFQEIVDEVRKRIPLYCPEWTDHNVSDPGITLIELFAWMTELLIYRLNQVPELHFIKFLEFLGVKPKPPSAAQTRVTFYLSKPLTAESDPGNQGLAIPAYTKVSTTQTETSGEPVIFTTGEPFTIYHAELQQLVVERRENETEQLQALQVEEVENLQSGESRLQLFSEPPRERESLWFGFANPDHDLSHHVLSLKLRFDNKVGIGINVKDPPYVWEAYNARGDWDEIKPDKESTRGLNATGEVLLHLPQLGKKVEPPGANACHWVRVRISQPTPEQESKGKRRYRESPQLMQVIQVATIGGEVAAEHVEIIQKEAVGVSDGAPGQHFFLDALPIMEPRREHERLRVKIDEEEDHDEELWQEAPHGNFASSQAGDRHYILNSLTGELLFGPAVRQPNGDIRRYGATPRRRARLIFEQYRYGGGARGNLQPKALNVLKSSIPYVDRVENRLPATGGSDAEALEAVKMRTQWLLRNRHLAVTPDDFRARVLEQFGNEIARVHCLPFSDNQKDAVRVLLIPKLVDQSPGYVAAQALQVSATTQEAIRAHLDRYRMLTFPVRVETSGYRRIRVQTRLTRRDKGNPSTLQKAVERRLYSYLHPLLGGADGAGWPFGQTITVTDLQRRLLTVPGIQSVTELQLYEESLDGKSQSALGVEVILAPDQTVISGRHQIEFV